MADRTGVDVEQRTCLHCKRDIPPERSPKAKYCSDKCNGDAFYARHRDQRREAVRLRYARQHPPRARATSCKRCSKPMPPDCDLQAQYCSNLCKWRQASAARYPRNRGPRPCRWCKELFIPRKGERPHVTYCSNYCRNKRNATDNAEHRAIMKANWRHLRRAQLVGSIVTGAQWAELVEQHEGRCAYCGVSPPVLTQDHVMPVIRGGEHSIDNLLPACQPCNSSKGEKTLDEWKQTPGYALRVGGVSLT